MLGRAFKHTTTLCKGLTPSLLRGFARASTDDKKDGKVDLHRGDLSPFWYNTLWDIPGAKKDKKRKGRGNASRKGKTAGRGHKGQGQRGTKRHPRFEGGQNPLHKRFPKIKYPTTDVFYEPIWASKVLYGAERNWLDVSTCVTQMDLWKSGLVSRPRSGVKLVSKPSEKALEQPITLEVAHAEEAAVKEVLAAGGHVRVVYRNLEQMNQHLYPEKYPYPFEEVYPPYHEVRRLLRLEKMGCEVVFRRAEWVGQETEAERMIKMATDGFEYPVRKYPGIALDRVRKRKETIEREVKLAFLHKK